MDLFTIKTNTVYGRYIVAARDIKEGELIIKERPVLIGSPIQGFHICFRCCKILRSAVQVCKQCEAATLCSKDCEGCYHSEEECAAFKSSGLKTPNLINKPQIVLPLRCLLIKQYDPNLWQILTSMEAHLDRRRHSPIWKRHEEEVQKPLEELNQLTPEDILEETVQRICGIFDVNSFEVRPKSSEPIVGFQECLRGLYVQASLMTHDCVGNTQLSVDDDFLMTVHASRAIATGETIFFNYGNCLKGTLERRQHLREGKYFDCVCKRCSDPTELGTYMSSIRCTRCKVGFVVPSEPLNDLYKRSWFCQNCETVYRGALIKSTVEYVQDKLISWDPANLVEGEQLLKKLQMSLSPRHYLILELKQNLIPLYEQNFCSDWAMRRKIQFCKDVIGVLEIVEPGISRLQGLAMFQLHSTQVNLANKLYQCKEIAPPKYLELLSEAEANLSAAVRCLLYEPKNSPEGRLTGHALNDLKILRSMIKQTKVSCESRLVGANDVLGHLTQKKKIKS